MTTKEKWIAGILVTVLIIVSVAAVLAETGKNKTNANTDPGQTLPAHCNPLKPGYDKNGYPDPFCGEAATPYSSPCDKNKPGYDMNGFPNPDCGFGRMPK